MYTFLTDALVSAIEVKFWQELPFSLIFRLEIVLRPKIRRRPENCPVALSYQKIPFAETNRRRWNLVGRLNLGGYIFFEAW